MVQPIVIIIMGVSGSGKTTIGKRLAAATGWNFHDADDDHSAESVNRMSRGEALTDEQRLPWLQTLAERVRQWRETGTPTVLACSALTERSRKILIGSSPRESVAFVHLRGSRDVISRRMNDREHFMSSSLLESQFDALEPPAGALELDASITPEALVERIRRAFNV